MIHSRKTNTSNVDSERGFVNLNDTHKENCVLLSSVQEFIEIEAWLPLTFSI